MSDIAKKIKPLQDRVIVKRLEAEEKTKSGIIIPDTAKEKPQQGEVVAVGDGWFNKDGNRVPLDVKAGDIVMFGKWGATEIKLEGQELLVLKQDDIIAVVNS